MFIKINSTISILPTKQRSALEEVEFQTQGGDKLKVTLYSEAVASLEVYNTFTEDVPYRLIKTLNVNNGFDDCIINDFHNYFKLKLIPASNQKCGVGVSLKEDSNSGYGSTQEEIDELNRMVPKFYDDAEVLAETAGKQPTMIAFKKDGVVIRTIQITYINEIFKRVQVL